MRRGLCILLLAVAGPLSVNAEANLTFQVGGKSYNLSGAQAVITTRNGKTQVMIAAKDTVQKAMFAITAEVPTESLENTAQVSAEFHPVSVVIMNTKGVYSLAPHVSLARDDFIRYTKKEEVDTGELEDDPDDNPEERIPECRRWRHFGHRFSKAEDHEQEVCHKLRSQQRRKRKKIRVEYKKHAPTWVNKSRRQRIDSGDGVMREEKYRDTQFTVNLTPVKSSGKITGFSGNFSGVIVYNEGLQPAVKTVLRNGTFNVQVVNVP